METIQTIMEAHQRAMNDATHGLIGQLMAKAAEVATANEQLATAKEELATANEKLATAKGELATANEKLAQAQASIVNMEVRLESKKIK